MLKHRMIIIISVIAVALPFIAAIENCDTPNDLPGHCIMMKDCPVLLAKHNANKGESGGPLVGGTETINEHGIAKIKNFQFGIVSIKTGCRLRGALPEVYTSVAYYMEWILNQMDH
ncbi:unnamed protein product [Diamesa hyperborea]